MPRPLWTGAIAFGLATIPVKLYSATERRAEIATRLLHDKDQAPIDYRRFCSRENVEVACSPTRISRRSKSGTSSRPSRSTSKAYQLLREALERSRHVGIAGGKLDLPRDGRVAAREVKLALDLVEALSGDFKPESTAIRTAGRCAR